MRARRRDGALCEDALEVRAVERQHADWQVHQLHQRSVHQLHQRSVEQRPNDARSFQRSKTRAKPEPKKKASQKVSESERFLFFLKFKNQKPNSHGTSIV